MTVGFDERGCGQALPRVVPVWQPAPTLARLGLLWVLVAACARAQAAPPTATEPSPVETGRTLFRNKGCVTCHANARVDGQTGAYGIGPDLTSYTNSPEFLRQWLADPQAVRPGTRMVDLDLTPTEIESLIAFLNAPRD